MENLQDAKGHQSLQEVSGPFHAIVDLQKRQQCKVLQSEKPNKNSNWSKIYV